MRFVPAFYLFIARVGVGMGWDGSELRGAQHSALQPGAGGLGPGLQLAQRRGPAPAGLLARGFQEIVSDTVGPLTHAVNI